MDTRASTDDKSLAWLRKNYPNWYIERFVVLDVEPDVWMATRTRVLTTSEMRDGLMHSLIEDTAEQLRDALAEQRRIELGATWERA